MSLVINAVSKKYQHKQALDQINLTFEKNKIYGLLGRNGAGKSTLLNIINNRSFATSGEVLLNDQAVTDREVSLNQIYLMSEDNLFPSMLRVQNIFKLTEGFYGDFDWEFANQMAAAFNLNPKQKLRKLSTGYRSIAKLITALAAPCEYVFLDEPILGLDATHRELFYQFLIEAFEKRPRTFIVSTHLIEEITNLLEEVILLHEGKVLEVASVEELLQSGKKLTGPRDVLLSLTPDLTVINQENLGGQLTVYVKGQLPADIPANVSVQPMNLQSYFIQLTKGKTAL